MTISPLAGSWLARSFRAYRVLAGKLLCSGVGGALVILLARGIINNAEHVVMRPIYLSLGFDPDRFLGPSKALRPEHKRIVETLEAAGPILSSPPDFLRVVSAELCAHNIAFTPLEILRHIGLNNVRNTEGECEVGFMYSSANSPDVREGGCVQDTVESGRVTSTADNYFGDRFRWDRRIIERLSGPVAVSNLIAFGQAQKLTPFVFIIPMRTLSANQFFDYLSIAIAVIEIMPHENSLGCILDLIRRGASGKEVVRTPEADYETRMSPRVVRPHQNLFEASR